LFPTSSWILYRSNPCSMLCSFVIVSYDGIFLVVVVGNKANPVIYGFCYLFQTQLNNTSQCTHVCEKKKDFPTHLIKKEREPQCTHVSEKKKLPHTFNLRREGNSGLAKKAQLPLDLKSAHLQLNETPRKQEDLSHTQRSQILQASRCHKLHQQKQWVILVFQGWWSRYSSTKDSLQKASHSSLRIAKEEASPNPWVLLWFSWQNYGWIKYRNDPARHETAGHSRVCA